MQIVATQCKVWTSISTAIAFEILKKAFVTAPAIKKNWNFVGDKLTCVLLSLACSKHGMIAPNE